MIRIALDAAGGDRGPEEVLRAAALVAGRYDITLVGPRELVVSAARAAGVDLSPFGLTDAPEVVGMGEPPSEAIRSKPRSSLTVGLELVASGRAEAFISAGNSGAVVAGALLMLGRLPGVDRPGVATHLPTYRGRIIIIDAGANADCRPHHLLQFGVMGSAYYRCTFGNPSPRVGLLNIGEEPSKGNLLARRAYQLLSASGLNFVGNVEGKDLPWDVADVVVTDGFSGNVALKTAEGVGEMLFKAIQAKLNQRLRYRLGGLLLAPAFRELLSRYDYAEYGGAPLLGVRGVVVLAHGRSNARALRGAIEMAAEAVRTGVTEAVARAVEQLTVTGPGLGSRLGPDDGGIGPGL